MKNETSQSFTMTQVAMLFGIPAQVPAELPYICHVWHDWESIFVEMSNGDIECFHYSEDQFLNFTKLIIEGPFAYWIQSIKL